MIFEQAVADVCARYGLTKAASMAMIRRFNEFNRLAASANPEIKAIGQKLVAQNARVVPKAFTPANIPIAQKLSAALGSQTPGLFTPAALNKTQNAISKVTGQSTLKPGIKGPTGL